VSTHETNVEREPVLALVPRLRGQISNGVGIALVAILILWLVVNLVKDPDAFISVLLSGITNGAVYALIALGYTLVYGIIELINFAHGDVFMWGTMISVTVGVHWFGLDGSQSGIVTLLGCVAVLFGATAFCAGLNVTIERVAYRKLRNAPRLAPLITAIGMSFILQNLGAVFFGFDYKQADGILPSGALFHIGHSAYREKALIVLIVAIPSLLILTYLVRYTRAGKAMRATAQDRDAARMLGINVDRTISFTFALGGALAGIGGFLYVMYFTTTRFDLGFQIGLFAFTAAVLGGIGNLAGAALGGLLIGLIQNFNEGLSWHAPGSDWTESIIFSLLILILVFRPQGLLGESQVTRA
jgi:branched-chain amino acid transport system permease protein